MRPRLAGQGRVAGAREPGAPTRARLALLGALLGLVACRGAEPERPLDGHHELCCKAAADDNVSFVGCRATGYCRASESVWVRGPVSCTALAVDECAGGRCCKLAVEVAAPREPVEDEADGPHEQPAEPAPPPARITPVPLDWQARPTLVAIPKLVCPATVERGVVGTVVLHVEVDARGRVVEVAVRRSLDPECDALARDALLHAQFEPALTPTGEAIAASLSWAYEFGRAEGGE